MRRVKRWRYYCDFCRKSGADSGHMKKHEGHCIRNPARVCGFCKEDGELEQRPIAELIAALDDGDEAGVAQLRKAAGGCPACMLAAIVQSGLQRAADEEDAGFHVEFDFKAERERFWRDHNEGKLFREEEAARHGY